MIQTTGKEMQIQKKGEKKRDEREFRCEEVFTRQISRIKYTYCNIQYTSTRREKKTQKKGRHRKVSTKKQHLRLTFEDTARFSNKHTLRQSKE
jgi:hypothetical protein